jgi:uncharacterized protein (TIGR02757 family)
MKNAVEPSKSLLSGFLNQVQSEYHADKYLYSDPIELVHRYRNPWDQEAVALLASVLAYGKVAQIRKSIEEALQRISRLADSPNTFVRELENPSFRKQARAIFLGFKHRFNKDHDPIILFELLSRSWVKYGSLGAHFTSLLSPQDLHIEVALSRLIETWKSWLPKDTPDSFYYFLTSPKDGSCCKRWCMFLRWMGRKDQIDPGLWTSDPLLFGSEPLKTSQLIMPLDTHTGRITQYLGLTTRKTLNWKTALEVTAALKLVDPVDPTRYDFALSRLGILELCQRSYRKEICNRCQLLSVCQFAQQKTSQSALRYMPH